MAQLLMRFWGLACNVAERRSGKAKIDEAADRIRARVYEGWMSITTRLASR